jgi:hypothetical protein
MTFTHRSSLTSRLFLLRPLLFDRPLTVVNCTDRHSYLWRTSPFKRWDHCLHRHGLLGFVKRTSQPLRIPPLRPIQLFSPSKLTCTSQQRPPPFHATTTAQLFRSTSIIKDRGTLSQSPHDRRKNESWLSAKWTRHHPWHVQCIGQMHHRSQYSQSRGDCR